MRKVERSKVYRLLYPTVPAIIAAAHQGKVAAMPVVSLVSLSNSPPLVGFSSSASHSTYKTILEAGRFSVSWMDRRFEDEITRLGTSSGSKTPDKLRSVGLHHRPGKVLGVPLIEEAAASLECRFSLSQRLGDHNLVVGEVKSAQAVDDFEEYWTFQHYSPLLYSGLGRSFRGPYRD
ncbi:MAG: flavin reductase family protein [Thaumarchaeota archaeon]|nr:flavin reductase family protein [Nitrososphaerota archaeon]